MGHNSISERISTFFRLCIPYSLILIIFLFSIIAVPYPLTAFFEAPLLLMMVYYWSVYRPTIMPVWVVCTLGLLFDIMTGMPYLGLNAALLMIARLIIVDQRRFLTGQAFPLVWIAFVVVFAMYQIVQWFFYSALSLQLMPLHDFGKQLMLGALVFPVVYALLNLTQKAVPENLSKAPSRWGSQKRNMSYN